MRQVLSFVLALVTSAVFLQAANLGTAVTVIGLVTDLVYDNQRQLVYLANYTENRIEVYSVGGQRLLAPLVVGNSPASLALSPDQQTLYVANNLTQGTISVVDLNSGALRDVIPLGSRPDSLAVGPDGLVVIMGSAGLLRLDPSSRTVTQVPVSPPPANPPGLAQPGPPPTPAGFRAALARTSDGRLIFGLSNNRLFVYEVASGLVLRSRTVGGLNAVMSVAPDGSRFMAGPFLFDTNTLTILGTAGLSAATLTGGSAFSLDGNTVYATFSTQTAINPLNPNNPQVNPNAQIPGTTRSLGVLQLLKSRNLAQQLGLRLPDNIIGKMIVSDDGQNLFAISSSGILVVPIGRLNQFPIVDVDTRSTVLSVDICNRNVQTISVNILNIGRGRLTYVTQAANLLTATGLAPPPGSIPPVILSQATGLAPGSVRITFDPRSLSTLARGTTMASVVIVSPEAVNIEPTITVSLNFRDVDQVGNIYPVTGTITDVVVDNTRQRVYLANSLLNQIEIFSISTQTFLPPIEVGAQPRSMALVGSNLMVVANSASENISVVDLDSLQQVDLISLGPVALNTQPLFPSSIAASNNASLFSTVPLVAAGAAPGNGNIWQLSLATRSAFPRVNLGTVSNTAVANVVDGRTVLAAPANGSGILIVSAQGGGTLRLYDPVTDNFPITRTAQAPALRGAVSVAPDGSFYVVDQTVFTSALSLLGTITGAAGTFTQSAAGMSGNLLYRVRTGTTAGAQADPLQRLERLSTANLTVNQSIPMVESVVASPFAPRGQVQLLPRAMTVDSPTGNAYAVTVSGLSVVPLAQPQGLGPTFTANQVVNGASFRAPVAPGSIISIFGDNLGDVSSATDVPLPSSLGGACVTINDVAMPLFYVSPKQINAQLPTTAAAGRVTLAVRSRNTGRASQGVTVTVEATSPGIFTVPDKAGRAVAAIFRNEDFSLVTQDNKPFRDERLVMYTTGLGATTPAVASGQPAPSAVLSRTGPVQVCIGRHPYPVEFSGLAPGFVGLYQLNLYVPGDRVQGELLPVVITMGGADCRTASTSGAPVTYIR